MDSGKVGPARCQECAFFDPPPGGLPCKPDASSTDKEIARRGGYCRRNSPGPSIHSTPRWVVWDMVKAEDWCGQGQVRQN